MHTYSWLPVGGNDSIATNLGANTYSCIITDSLGCTATQNIIITEPSQVEVPSICLVTVDDLGNNNVIVWEKHYIKWQIHFMCIEKSPTITTK
ncbi:MAG: hypothetical protein IPG89_19235 [Bacteroidetes bacterium]|nr:hypothetical protein [Bacteroidota bacterium]